MDKRASPTAYGAVANSDMIEIYVNFEPNLTTMTGTVVCLFHGVRLLGVSI
jgi:hypothetical protein